MIVVVHGNTSAGREAASKLLVEQYGFERYSVMTPVRDALLTIDPLIAGHTTLRSQVEPNGWGYVLSRPVFRNQVVRYLGGTARMLRSTFGHDVLIDLLISRMTEDHGGHVPEHARILIDDARHTDEVESLRSRVNAVVISVESSRGDSDRLPDRIISGKVTFELDDIDELAEQLEELMGLSNNGPAKIGRPAG